MPYLKNQVHNNSRKVAVGLTDTQTLTNKTITNPAGMDKNDVGLSAVENTALSTWGGSSNLGTVASTLITTHTFLGSSEQAQTTTLGGNEASWQSGISLNYQPTSSSSKLLITAGIDIHANPNNNGGLAIGLYEGTTAIGYPGGFAVNPYEGQNMSWHTGTHPLEAYTASTGTTTRTFIVKWKNGYSGNGGHSNPSHFAGSTGRDWIRVVELG